MKRSKFFVTELTVTVLSEGAGVGDMSLVKIAEECESGCLVLGKVAANIRQVGGKVMADELYKAGSEPSFFQLDDAGKEV